MAKILFCTIALFKYNEKIIPLNFIGSAPFLNILFLTIVLNINTVI